MEATGGKNLARKERHRRDKLVSALGGVVADELNDANVGRYTSDPLLAGAMPATVNRELATLSHMLRTAARRGKLPHQPCNISKFKEEMTPRTSLTVADAERNNLPPDKRDGWIFPAKSDCGHIRQFNEPFRRVVVAAGPKPKIVTPHLLRHTAITRLAERGVAVATIHKISGHKTAAMVMRYTHIVDPAVDEAMRVLEDANRADYTEITPKADEGLTA